MHFFLYIIREKNIVVAVLLIVQCCLSLFINSQIVKNQRGPCPNHPSERLSPSYVLNISTGQVALTENAQKLEDVHRKTETDLWMEDLSALRNKYLELFGR